MPNPEAVRTPHVAPVGGDVSGYMDLLSANGTFGAVAGVG